MTTINSSWHPIHKIAFRFLFVFFVLEIFLTTDFAVLITGIRGPLILWSQKVFTPPFRWLNDSIFHFYYNTWGWFTFTFTLSLVRFICFLMVSLVASLVWTLLDTKRQNYIRLDAWTRQILVLLLSCVMWGYGIDKVFAVQMPMLDFKALQSRLGEIHPFYLFWYTMGYGVPYQVFAGLGEVAGAVLILFRPTRLFGLLILTAMLVNIVVINYAYAIGVLALSSFLLLITLYLLVPYRRSLSLFLFTHRVVVKDDGYEGRLGLHTRFQKRVLGAVALLIVGSSYLANGYKSATRYNDRVVRENSTRYWNVKKFVVNNDTLSADRSCLPSWRFWEERLLPNGYLVTIHSVNGNGEERATYTVTRDSMRHLLVLVPIGQESGESISLHDDGFSKKQRTITGVVDGKNVQAVLEELNLAEYSKLLRTRRQIFETDPAEYY